MKVRFNLGFGQNYRKWQVTLQNKEKLHYDPLKCQMTIYNGVLCNKRNHADKIFNGSCKMVCSWIECVTVITNFDNESNFSVTELDEIKYNPRKAPYWTNDRGENLDGTKYSSLVTNGNRIYIRQK